MSSYTKLVGTSKDGDFVHQFQTMAGDDGFRNVSQLWFDKCITFDDTLNEMHEENTRCRDELVPVKNINLEVDKTNGVGLSVDGEFIDMTNHSRLQLATWCDLSHGFVNQMTAPKTRASGSVKYERDNLDADLLKSAFENGKRRLDQDKNLMLRLKTVDNGTELRAVFSDEYSPLGNIWYMEILQQLMPTARLSHWRGDIDSVYGNVLIPDSIRQEDDSEYGGMISIGNSEIGKRRLSQKPSVFRAICMNGCIWGQLEGKDIRQVHRRAPDLNTLRRVILDNINAQIPLVDTVVTNFLSLREKEIHQDLLTGVFTVIAKDLGLSRGLKGHAMELVNQYNAHEQDNSNLFGVVNALTRASQTFDNAGWVAADEYAGEIAYKADKQLNRLTSLARGVDSADVEKVFGVAV